MRVCRKNRQVCPANAIMPGLPVVFCQCYAMQVLIATLSQGFECMSNSLDKSQIHEVILAALEALVTNAKNAMLLAYETATHEENIAENKYDTLGLEAAYLTQGQARRLAECEADLEAYRHHGVRTFDEDDPIAVGALVELSDEAGNGQFLLLGPAAGGLKISANGCEIMVITPSAPLGKALLNASVGDSVSVNVAARQKRYNVVAIF